MKVNNLNTFKILFLDIDGVLNNEKLFLDIRRRCHDARESGKPLPPKREVCWPFGHLQSKLIARLNILVEQTGCKIVLSSSWRAVCKYKVLAKWLKSKGFKYPEAFIGSTGRGNNRGEEVADWLANNAFDVSNYVILDDCDFDLVELHPNNTVRTDMKFGLTDADVTKAVEILNR
jgi:hypothetical protein